MTHPFWPLFDLEVRTPTLTLRYIDDELGTELATLMQEPIHDPAEMPFSMPWTDAPSPVREREAFRFWWRCRSATTSESWNINFAIVVDGRAVGACGMSAEHFPVLRSFGTGSWIGLVDQGRGYGKEMRAALLHLGFAGFEAVEATTAAFANNPRSLGVTRHHGYEPNGSARTMQRDTAGETLRFRMPREHWDTVRRDDITIDGLERAKELLGLAPGFTG